MTLSRAITLGCVLLTSLVGAVALPLLTYTATLAIFGLAHVVTELHYVHARFGPRLHRRLSIVLLALLAGVVGARVAAMTGLLERETSLLLELALATALVASTLPLMWRRGAWSFGTATLIGVALLAGLLISPIHTLLFFAVAHNITPIGFLVEAAPPRRRALTALGTATIFVGVPLLIATGWPATLLGEWGASGAEVSLLPAGPLSAHLGAYFPAAWHEYAWVHHAFSAVVFAQCMHYAVVIGVMPKLLGEDSFASRRKWTWWLGIVGICATMLVLFWFDFSGARRIYGIAATVHAWVEIPILILSLSALGAATHKEAPR